MNLNIRRYLYPFFVLLLLLSLALTFYFMVKALRINSAYAGQRHFHHPQYHFVLIPEETDNSYWRLVKKGADAAAAKYDAVVEYNGPVQSNIDEHIKLTEMATASKVDGIITQGLSNQMVPVINNAIDQGIPVLTIDTDAPKSRRLAYIGTNNYQAGVLAGKTLAKAMNGHAKVGIITGSFTSLGQKLRVKGFRHAIKAYPGIKIVEIESSHISRIQAAEQTYEIYKNHPDVNAFFGTSALDGLGISAITQQLGKTKSVYILAFDTLPSTLKLMKQGVINATIEQRPYQMGYESVKLMIQTIEGRSVKPIHHLSTKVVLPADLPLKGSDQGKGSIGP